MLAALFSVSAEAISFAAGQEARAPAPESSVSAGHRLMLKLLQSIADRTPNENPYLGDWRVREFSQQLAELPSDAPLLERWQLLDRLGRAEFYAGHFPGALAHREELYRLMPKLGDQLTAEHERNLLFDLGMTNMRIGEATNCALRNTPESCILPLRGGAIHSDQRGSRAAIRYFTELLDRPGPRDRLWQRTRWLVNLVYMTVDEYPHGVPPQHLIPPAAFASEREIPRFENIAARLALDTFSMSGGVIADDFDNDTDLDLLVSDWNPTGQIRFWVNNGDGSFTDRTESAGLVGIFGGLNLVQADYDNDGDVDAFVLRGAWLGKAGAHPNSLLRNNGDNTFTDVTFEAGLGQDRYPTQTGSWADFDLDGDLDLYVGNESTLEMRAPSQLYRNNGDGTFTDVATSAGVRDLRPTKGTVAGDYDGDRWPDIYVSNLGAPNRLYRNNRDGTFTDVAPALGVDGPRASFPVWFWDFDNDGALDIYVSSYPRSVAQIAASYLGEPVTEEKPRLYRGDGRGGFTDVAAEANLRKLHEPMGANFGDLDGDGYLDFYLGTGFPPFWAISPNAMYLNLGGRSFADVSTAGGFAHLQKGHAIAFADLDHDGDLDVFAEMGGAVPGDEYHNALFENPGFGHRWLTVKLVGVRSNRSAIGARLRVVVTDESGGERTIYRHVCSGGSFGASPLRQTIGLGKARSIDLLEVFWPASNTTQTFEGLALDSAVEIREGQDALRPIALRRFRLTGSRDAQEPVHRHPPPPRS